jgi:hypothetical protein
LQLRDQVRVRIGVPVVDGFQDAVVIDQYINHANDLIEAEARWPWQETVASPSTVAGTATVAVPTDWRASRSLFIEDDEIHLKAPADIYQWNADDRGRPQVWALIGSDIHLRPVPDVVYTLTHLYYKTPTVLEADDDTADMPDYLTGSIVAKAAELLAIREDDRGAASAHLAEYVGWLARMRKEMRRTTGPLRIRVREGSWV